MSKLSSYELKIMHLFWNTNESWLATGIMDAFNKIQRKEGKKEVSISGIQHRIKSLLDKGMIEVDTIVVVSKANTRKYKAKISADDYAVIQMKHYFPNGNPCSFVSALLDSQKDNREETLDQLEMILQKARDEIERDSKS